MRLSDPFDCKILVCIAVNVPRSGGYLNPNPKLSGQGPMRLSTSRGIAVLLIAATTASMVSSRAGADELLVMPYSCRVVGGRPVLTPSEDQGHAVIGRREQQEFQACSRINPDMCRKWTVHRFDLDCDGVRVPWMSVAAAADAHQGGRSHVANGRLEIEMPPQWDMPANAPCARLEERELRRPDGAFRRYCEERMAEAPPAIVAMPRGFAPMLGIDGIFVAASSKPPKAIAKASPPGGVAPPVEKAARVEPPPAAPERASRPVEKAPVSPPPPPVPATAPKEASSDASAAGSAVAGAAPLIPKIINGEGASPVEPPADANAIKAEPSPAPSASTSAQSPPVAELHVPPAEIVPSPPADPDAGLTSAIPVTVVRVPGHVDAGLLAAGGVAALALLAAAVAYRRRRARSLSPLSRDIAAVSFDARTSPGNPATLGMLPAVIPPTAPGRDLEPPSSLPPGPPAPVGDAVPRTREEALGVLGIGVAPDLNEVAIKKIIDGLRLAWNPDHARDAADRAIREVRLKQLNVAWDILAGRGAGSPS